ncbi:MAG: hypothetical protein ABIK07_05450 [Planctomycetota bacterium]
MLDARNPNRIEVFLAILNNAWRAHPDWRLGQLLVNVINPEDGHREIFWIADDALMTKLAELISKSQEI